MNSELASIERPQFALRLEDGRGQLVLSRRRIGTMVELDVLAMSMRDVPQRLDLTSGVERFRHTWSNLETLRVSIDDLAMTRFLRDRLAHRPLGDLEVRISGGDVYVAGELNEGSVAPFLVRLRIEPAGAPALQSIIVSAFSARIYAPHDVSAPIVAGWLLEAFGDDFNRQGCSLGVVSPLPALMGYIFSELGWKIPAFRDVGIEQISVEAGRIHLKLSRPEKRGASVLSYAMGRASDARFLADYEAKLLFEDNEYALWLGERSRVMSAYERQLELHANHPFLLKRLIQMHSAGTNGASDARLLAGLSERVGAVTIDTQIALAVASLNEDRPNVAADAYAKALSLAEREGQGLEISQIQCAYAVCLEQFDLPKAEQALESALGYRRRLPGALRRLSALQAKQDRWAEAIRTRERLLLDEGSSGQRFALLLELGELALQRGTGEQAIEFFVRASQFQPHSAVANRGLGRAYISLDQTLSGIRALDQAVRLFQGEHNVESAAELLVEIGDVWCVQAQGAASAIMRYRQALSLKPGFGKALVGISRVSRDAGDIPTARSALEELLRAAENGQSDVDRFQAMLELGSLLIAHSDTQPQGIPFLQRCLDGPAVVARLGSERLEELYESTERWHDLVRHLEGMLKKNELIDDVRFRVRLAELMDAKLTDPSRALTVLMTVKADGDKEVLLARVDLQRRLKMFAQLEVSLDALSHVLIEPVQVADVHAERGDLLRFELNRSETAIEAYGSAVACDPSQVGALKGLVDLYREQERFGELASTIEQMVGYTDGFEKVDLLTELSRVRLEQLGRRESALESITQAFELDGDEPAVLRMMIQAQRSTGDISAALASYERLHSVYQVEGYDEPAAPFKHSIGELCELNGRDDEALRWYKDALNYDVNFIDAYESCQDAMLKNEGLEATLNYLQTYLDKALSPRTEHFLRLRIGRLAWRELRQAERAFELLKPMLAVEPVDEDVVGLMLEMATVLEDWPQVGRLLEQRLNCVGETERPGVLLHLAKLSLNELQQTSQAQQFAEAAVSEAPGFVPGLVMLSELAFERHAWEEVESMIQKLSEVERYVLTAEDLFRRAVAALHCGSAGRAVSSLRIVEMMGSYFPGMWGAFVEGYLQMGDYGPISRVVDRMLAEELQDPGTAGLLKRCVLIEEVELSEQVLTTIQDHGLMPEDSRGTERSEPPIVDAFAETRSLDAALVAEVDASFDAAPPAGEDERFVTGEFASWVPESGEVTDFRLAATLTISPVMTDGLVDNEELLSSTSPTHLDSTEADLSDGETESFNEAAGLAATQSVGESVVMDIESDIATQDTSKSTPKAPKSKFEPKLDAQDEAFLEFVRKMPTEQELDAPDSEATALIDAIDASDNDQDKAQMLLNLAELRRDRLFQPDLALVAFWQAVECASPTSDVWREAVEALEDIYTLDNDWNQLIKLLDLRIESGQEDELELYLIKGATLRSSGRLDAAVETIERALELGERAVELLVNVLERQGKLTRAAEQLINGADAFGGVVGDDYRLRAAQLLESTDPTLAVEQLSLLNNKEVRDDALDLHLRLAEQLNVFEALPDLYVRKSEAVPNNTSGQIRGSQYLVSAAEVCKNELADLERACAFLQSSLDIWGDNVDALGILRGVQTALEDFAGVAECLSREIELSLPGPFRGQLKVLLAELLAGQLDDAEGARVRATDALEELVSESDKLRVLNLLARMDGQVADVLSSDLVVEALSRTDDFVAASESLQARLERLENVLGLDPSRSEAYEELASLYRAEKRYEELASVLERHSTFAETDQVCAELLLERAGVAQDHLRDQQLSRRLWERVIDLEDADLPSTRFALISLLGTNPRRVDLERLLEKLNRRIEESNGTKRAGLLSLRAELWHRHLGETNRARADLEAAISADEFNTVALFALSRIAMGRGELPDASAWARDVLHAPGILEQTTVVVQVLGELKAAFVKQDQSDDWSAYLASLISEHQDEPELVSLLSGLSVNERE
jgi:tetratricopeptide (TPR) repeat protein